MAFARVSSCTCFTSVHRGADWQMAMDEMDPDGSGEIDFEEFHA